jgi:hypothetical protein
MISREERCRYFLIENVIEDVRVEHISLVSCHAIGSVRLILSIEREMLLDMLCRFANSPILSGMNPRDEIIDTRLAGRGPLRVMLAHDLR